jgi:small-conductance mechanosensitive channel
MILRVIIILIGAYFTTRFLRTFIIRLTKSYIKKSSKIKGAKNAKIQKQREKTLASVFISTLSFAVWTMTILMVLSEFSINITPLLGGAGIVGLAIGMGSRSLIQDYLSGLFILLEDQYRVGEKVEIAGVKGKVKGLNLRRTVLENSEGTICYIPNGQIKKVSNFSR